jgi:hypothetical protein
MPNKWVAMEDWAQVDADNAKKYQELLKHSKKSSSAAFDFYTAAEKARWSVQDTKLLPRRTELGELEYRLQQGLMAACLAREDVAVIAGLQLPILQRLDRNRNYLAVAIALLVYIASKLG